MQVAFSLKEPISCEKICAKINEIVSKNIKTPQDAENYLVVISLSKVQDEIETKSLEQKI